MVTRELLRGRSAVRTWAIASGQVTLLASAALSDFTQLTVPTLGNSTLANDRPLVGFLGRVGDLPFAYFANRSGNRNDQELVSNLKGDTLATSRAMASHKTNLLFVAQYSTPSGQARVAAFTYDADLVLEIDWTVPRRDAGDRSWTNAPPPGAIERLVRMFAAAPLTNLDLSTGIILHVDAGHLRDPGGGQGPKL